jgi:hypothetical protein
MGAGIQVDAYSRADRDHKHAGDDSEDVSTTKTRGQ